MEATSQNLPLNTQPNNSQSEAFGRHPAPDQPRTRSKSDTSTRPPTWAFTTFDPPPSINRVDANLSDNRRYSRSKGGLVQPPTSYQDSTNDPNQFLHPIQTVANTDSGSRSRSSSRAFADRAIGALPSVPYPSPDGSPSLNYQPLPNLQDLSISSDMERSRPTSMVIGRPNGTSTTTAEAGERRRRTDGTFACPLPGCGRTFEKDARLKDHLRSHNEERPFRCKWPGCGKEFARDHDCKRHEQLHSKHRP